MGFLDTVESWAEGEEFTESGRRVVCSHCGNATFEKSSAQLNTPGLTFLGLDWANRSATVYACTNCGHLEWFL